MSTVSVERTGGRELLGIHHVTAIAGDPQENVDFYVRRLGLRLVKKSVNQDDPSTYHLFYADGAGNPGTDLTFFPSPNAARGRPGAGQAISVAFAVPERSLSYWIARLRESGESIWTADRLAVNLSTRLEDGRLFVVSNREPYMHVRRGKLKWDFWRLINVAVAVGR